MFFGEAGLNSVCAVIQMEGKKKFIMYQFSPYFIRLLKMINEVGSKRDMSKTVSGMSDNSQEMARYETRKHGRHKIM